MATQRLLGTRNTTFGELLGNGRRYGVPAFQRDYAWSIENWEDLWQDILIAHTEGLPHFMGAIVTQLVGNDPLTFGGHTLTFEGKALSVRDKFAIIDGQQRLATLSILVIAVIERLRELAKSGIEPEANQERQEILRRTYLGDRDPGSLRYASKLSLNENNNGFYQDNLINLRAPKNPYVLMESERLLWKAYLYFLAQLTQHDEIGKSGALLSNLLTETVAKRLKFIQISVEQEDNAYVLFETLNSRGVELGSADLLKNYLFSQLRGPDDYSAGKREWQRIIRTVGMSSLPNFLSCFLSMTGERVQKRRLFKTLKRSVTNAEQAFSLLMQLNECSDLYVALHNSNDDYWRKYDQSKQVKKWIRQINLLEATQFYPVLLAAADKFDDSKFEKLLKVATVLSFRLIVSKFNLNELERECNNLSAAIFTGKVKSPKAAFDKLSSLYIEDRKFQQDFSFLEISDQRQKGFVKYILRQLEQEASGKDVAEDSFSIEHILPQNPNQEWLQDFEGQKTSSLIYRLGNLTPLEPSVNSALGRANYAEKRQCFEKSAYLLTQSIQAEAWTVETIINRQEKMAERAVQIWQLNDYRQ